MTDANSPTRESLEREWMRQTEWNDFTNWLINVKLAAPAPAATGAFNEELERKKFEEWAKAQGWRTERPSADPYRPDEYASSGVQGNWLGWQARARAVSAPEERGTPPQSPIGKSQTPITVREGEAEGTWIAHSLEFDLIGCDPDRTKAIEQLKVCLGAQIAFGRKRGITNCYFPAPIEYWIPPYEFLPMPTEEEIAAFKFEESNEPLAIPSGDQSCTNATSAEPSTNQYDSSLAGTTGTISAINAGGLLTPSPTSPTERDERAKEAAKELPPLATFLRKTYEFSTQEDTAKAMEMGRDIAEGIAKHYQVAEPKETK